MPVADTQPASPQPASPAVHSRRCENCGAPLYGEHCHGCGQPTRGLVRHFSSVLGDFFDTVFNIDSRVLRTLGPLLARPGFLSLEYFAGRRVRYVTPMRLFLFLSLLAFFTIQASVDISETGGPVTIGAEDGPLEVRDDAIERAATEAEVQAQLASALAKLAEARKQAEGVPGAAVGIDIARDTLKRSAAERTAVLREQAAARAAGRPVPTEGESKVQRNRISFPNRNGKPWDPKSNPFKVSWLPDLANDALNKRLGHARDVLNASNSQKPLLDAMFNVLPQTLIVLMPLFALMLKVAYFFKRRLYMEHLIVALHSHSFIALALTLVMLTSWLQEWLAPGAGFGNSLLGWIRGLTIAWIPLYLLLMQKRVYMQGWTMTVLKFSVLGICYSVLLGFGLVGAILVGLLTI